MATKSDFMNVVNLNYHTAFPYVALDATNEGSCPHNPSFRIMHWHEDLQYMYVLRGTVRIKTLNQEVPVGEGEGVFINKNVVHLVQQQGICHYMSFIFPDYFLKFPFTAPAENFVNTIVGNEGLEVYPFTKKEAWCGPMLENLQALTGLEKNKTRFYIYEVLVRLTTMWLLFLKNVRLPSRRLADPVNPRMAGFLKFFEEHYAEPLTLEALAQSANVSKSECLRCFRKSLHTTPFAYLMELRLAKAAARLKDSDAPIGAIAVDTGFQQVSYFGKCFRRKLGMSPRAYRQQHFSPEGI